MRWNRGREFLGTDRRDLDVDRALGPPFSRALGPPELALGDEVKKISGGHSNAPY